MVLLSFLMAATGYCFDINRFTNEYGEVITPTETTIAPEERGLSLYINKDDVVSASLQEGDVFNVTYRKKGTVEEASFSYDAYEYEGHSTPKECVIHIPNGEYEIISVEYTGTNPYILSHGYMVVKEFSVYEDEQSLCFGLLDEEIDYIENKKEYYLSTYLIYDPSGQITGTASTSPKVTRSKEELESASVADKVKEMFSQESKNQGEVLEKRYTSESNEDTLVNNINSLLKKLGISAVIMLLGLLVILILKKTGKVK